MKNECTNKIFDIFIITQLLALIVIVAWTPLPAILPTEAPAPPSFSSTLLAGACFEIVTKETRGTEPPTFNDLLDAIEWVESGGDSNVVGDNGNAVGSFQIWKIYVRDVNRILGYDKYTYEDRWDKDKSREMVTVYLNNYGGTFEEMARKHNGGPGGHKKEATKQYWIKVRNYLDNLQ